jgi:cell wall-associated NlpC family hydrolase
MSDANPGTTLALAAENLVGIPFRLHGRDPATGLDCVGVLAAAMAAIGRSTGLPDDYALRMQDIARFTRRAAEFGFVSSEGPALPGDVLLFHVGPCQYHFAICGEGGSLVHAHAGLRRVVRSAALTDWSRIGHWRLEPNN